MDAKLNTIFVKAKLFKQKNRNNVYFLYHYHKQNSLTVQKSASGRLFFVFIHVHLLLLLEVIQDISYTILAFSRRMLWIDKFPYQNVLL